MRRALRVAWLLGPYVGVGVLAWRQVRLELDVVRFVAAGNRVMQAASADLAGKATELHEEAVTRGAQRN